MIRVLDIIFSLIGILLFFPLIILISVLIIVNSRGGIFYIQKRIGMYGKAFLLIKFRTMYINAHNKGLITVGNRDERITSFGYYLRKYKLDEIPQILNIIKGEMSFVGPRPEVEKYVNLYTNDERQILNVKPGITDYASIEYSNENEFLAISESPEEYYTNVIMRDKIRLNMVYIKNRNLKHYFKILILTVIKIIKN